MFITGFKTRSAVVADGMFVCPVCKEAEVYVHSQITRWFTVFFVPVFTIRNLGEQIQCQRCQSCFDPAVVQAATSDEVVVASLVEKWNIDAPELVAALAQPTSGIAPTTPGISPRARVPSQISKLAVASLTFAILSFMLICVCGLSAVPSLVAIVTGHLALANIRRSAVPLGGATHARVGLTMGYVTMVLTILGLVLLGPAVYEAWNREQKEAAARPSTGADSLREAESRVLTAGTEGIATGNTADAKTLAEAYATALSAMRRELFTEQKKGFSLTQGNFVVHCERRATSCAFVVHVPSYRNFTDEAKQELEKRAWQLAEEVAASQLKKGDDLAVGLRGTALYGAVLIGEVGDESPVSQIQNKREALMEFFEPEAEPEVVPAAEAEIK